MKSRIAFISEHSSPLALLGGVDNGGQNVYVDQVAKHLVSLGYEVDVFTRWEDEQKEQIVEYSPNIRVVHIQAGPKKYIRKEEIFPFMDEFASNMIKFIRSEAGQYDMVHANFWMSGYVASHLKNVLGIPYVITFHALGRVRRLHQKSSDGFPDIRFDIEEMVAHHADRVIAECPQDREDLTTLYHTPEEKITIIPCGFNKKEFFPMSKKTARKQLQLDMNEKIILQLGRMVPRKGVDDVVRSLKYIRQTEPDLKVRLLIVGGESSEPDPTKTPEIGRLQKIAEEDGVADMITFVGARTRNQLKYYYNAADAFASTPWYEPFGITPLEAMACGTPVIGSNVGGIKYTVVDDETGYLVEPKNPEQIAQAFLKIISNPTRAKEMRINAIKRVNTLFTWSRVAQEIAQVYEQNKKTEQRDETATFSFSELIRYVRSKMMPELNKENI